MQVTNGDIQEEKVGGGKTAIGVVYSSLMQAILNGEIEPESRLRIENLRLRYGVGSSTVREALSRLLVENLVTTQGQKGFRVAPVSMADFEEIVKMRALLESAALLESMENGDDEWEGNLVAAHHRLAKIEKAILASKADEVSDENVRDWEFRNRDFHDALYAACHNRWLQKFRNILYNQSVRYLRISISSRSVPRDVRAEHQAIFDAAIGRDKVLAEKLLREHIGKSIGVLAERIPGGKFASSFGEA
ncbi:GntR family transcriptional regulator [Profundibacter sp.]|uniref:GntR family transcriptional regulator n=1 Tax=Profundibacter sp. TaxID=3101071 RepID=UPI003D0F081F